MTIAAFGVTFIVYVTLAASAGITRSLKSRKRNIKWNIIYCTNFTKKRQQCKKTTKAESATTTATTTATNGTATRATVTT